MIFFQDRGALAQEYEQQGTKALVEARQRTHLGLDAKASIAWAQMCYKRLSSPSPTPENIFHMGETYVLQRQFPAAESIYRSLAPSKYEIKFPGIAEGEITEVRSKPGDTLNPTDIVAVATTAKGPIEVRAETDGKIVDVPVKTGDTIRGGQVLAVLARGYGPAHYEVAKRILASPRLDARLILLAERHLVMAREYKIEPYASMARLALYNIMRGQNRTEAAEHELVEAVKKLGDQEPQLRLTLAYWYAQNGKRDQAEDQAKKAVDSLEKRVEDNPNEFEPRVTLIGVRKFSGGLRCARGDFKKGVEDFARGRELCQRGLVMTSEPALRQKYLLELCYLFLAQFDGTMLDPNTTVAERFNLLDQALSLRPDDQNLIQRLSQFMKNSGPEGDKAREQIQRMIDQGKNLALGYMIKGTEAWEKNDPATAKYYWEKAMEQPDFSPDVANNLAWVLAMESKPPDPERGLMIVNQAIAKDPDKPQYHGTKGHILTKLERYPEALRKLEAARPAYANIPKEAYRSHMKQVEEAYRLYKTLSEVCSRLKMETESARYAKLAADILATAKAATPGGAAAPAPEVKGPSAAPAAAPASDAKGPTTAPAPDTKGPPAARTRLPVLRNLDREAASRVGITVPARPTGRPGIPRSQSVDTDSGSALPRPWDRRRRHRRRAGRIAATRVPAPLTPKHLRDPSVFRDPIRRLAPSGKTWFPFWVQ